MKIGLIDVDGHNFPNLPLMKLSAWHKLQGDEVEMVFPLAEYDRVYMSKVFTFTPDYTMEINAPEVIRGGTGYSLSGMLPDEIERIYPDYNLYNITDTAYGFLTRGCPRACPFCIVSAKEGRKSRQVADLDDFYRNQKTVRLLDPNILAHPYFPQMFTRLAASGAWIDFTQGLDARLLNQQAIGCLNTIRMKTVHFAWDTDSDNQRIITNLTEYAWQTDIRQKDRIVYVLTNYDTTFDFDLHRVYTLRDIGYAPYIMVYNRHTADRQYKRLQRWVNNRVIFWQCPKFEDYKA